MAPFAPYLLPCDLQEKGHTTHTTFPLLLATQFTFNVWASEEYNSFNSVPPT